MATSDATGAADLTEPALDHAQRVEFVNVDQLVRCQDADGIDDLDVGAPAGNGPALAQKPRGAGIYQLGETAPPAPGRLTASRVWIVWETAPPAGLLPGHGSERCWGHGRENLGRVGLEQ
jgi:hypothetical protein